MTDMYEPVQLPIHEVIEGPYQLTLGLRVLVVLDGGLRDERPGPVVAASAEAERLELAA